MRPIKAGDEVVHRYEDMSGVIVDVAVDKVLVQWRNSWEKIGDLLKCPEWSDGTD